MHCIKNAVYQWKYYMFTPNILNGARNVIACPCNVQKPAKIAKSVFLYCTTVPQGILAIAIWGNCNHVTTCNCVYCPTLCSALSFNRATTIESEQ
jgi:hypothetical protein